MHLAPPGPAGAPAAAAPEMTSCEAARKLFAERGYAGATIRAIAQEAGVDGALIHHFFASKEGVFAAAIEDTFAPSEMLPPVLQAGAEGMGERLVRTFLNKWEEPTTDQQLLAVLRSAVSNEEAAQLLRNFLTQELLGRIGQALKGEDAELRATLDRRATGRRRLLALRHGLRADRPHVHRVAGAPVESDDPALSHRTAGRLRGSCRQGKAACFWRQGRARQRGQAGEESACEISSGSTEIKRSPLRWNRCSPGIHRKVQRPVVCSCPGRDPGLGDCWIVLTLDREDRTAQRPVLRAGILR